MDRLFLEGASGRRKFFDRLVIAHEADHAARLNRYDKNLRERLRLLQDGAPDPVWLDTLESQLAGDAVCIAASRRNLLEHLARYVDRLYAAKTLFPRPEAAVIGWTEDETGKRPALEIEDELKARFKASRNADAVAGKSREGVHRSDFTVRHAGRGMPADQCSTGEQKGLLISIVLAHTLMMQGERGFAPLLLLDEIAAHLDDTRREELLQYLASLDAQVFLTGTDAAAFASLKDGALFCAVENARVTPQPRSSGKVQAV
jgi:DNA replication and repair protein RecF